MLSIIYFPLSFYNFLTRNTEIESFFGGIINNKVIVLLILMYYFVIIFICLLWTETNPLNKIFID